MSHRVVFIQGGGVGLDQELSVRQLIAAAGVAVEWQHFCAGAAAMEEGLDPLPSPMLEEVASVGVALKTKLLNPPDGKHPNFNVELRRRLGLFASVRPIRNVPGLPARYSGLNILLIREITEDLYTAGEHEIVPGVVQSLKIVTEAACRRFFRFCFELARAQGRKLIHCIHKANILKMADGLFLECFRQAAREFPDIQAKDLIVDNCCMQLITKPRQFDVLVAGNLYGDLLSDLGAGLVGGISAAVGINHGEGVRVYEAIHGRSREGLGEDRANPLPLLLPALELLQHLGEQRAAERLRSATERVLHGGQHRTFDLGGSTRTSEMTAAIEAEMR
jgi:isocitrate dehydrogenase (NAD+)